MRKTPQFIIDWVNKYWKEKNLLVRMLFALLSYLNIFNYKNNLGTIIWGQSAWLLSRFKFNNHQRLNVEQPKKNFILIHNHSNNINRSKLYNQKENFYQWLVGFTDGDGCFTISRSIAHNYKPKWNLFYKIGQSSYNARALYFIKKELGCGSVHFESKTTNADFRIRNRVTLNTVIFPIFDKYPLLTSKYFYYLKFKKAYNILEDTSISYAEKDKLLLILINEKIPKNYISLAWNKVNNNINDTNDAKCVMSKYWLIGFTEAEGSFYLVSKSPTRLVHAFEITQKLDFIVLKSISHILGISVKKKIKYNTVITTNSRAILNIIDYYKNTMKGMKALEYRIWATSFVKYKGNYDKLYKTRNLMRKIRSIRLDNKCHIMTDDIND